MSNEALIWETAEPRRRFSRPETFDVAFGAAVATIQIVYMAVYNQWGAGLFLTVTMSAAVMFARRAPAIALAIVWLAGVVQIWLHLAPQPSQVAIVWVAYCTARYSSQRVLVISGFSALAGTVFSGAYLYNVVASSPSWYVGFFGSLWRVVQGLTGLDGPAGLFFTVFVGIAPLILPWSIGLVMRLLARSRTSEQERSVAIEEKGAAEALRDLAQRERENAMRVAAVEAHQARLARDVHDVVGHSLAVILAQAQAGQMIEGEAAMKETLDNIANSARRSLNEVRQVLGELRDGTPQAAPVDGVAALADSLRVAGVDVRESVTGQPRPLPPEVATVVYRVMQEMVTNVLKHGQPGGIVSIDYLWQNGLRVQIRNFVGEMPGEGQRSGIAGMRARLESVGGSLEILRYGSDEGEIVSATAWVPSGGMA